MIKINELSFTPESNKILDNISCDIPSCKVTCVIGENGSGKSSMLKMVSGVWNPTSGNIEAEGINVILEPVKAKEKMGYVAEIPFFYESLTGEEYIELICGLRKISFDKVLFDKYSDLFLLKDFTDTPFFEMPKGIRQKWAIVAAFYHDPDIIILDEPVNGLDPVGVKTLKQLITDRASKGKTVLFATHILEIAEKISDNIVVLKKGQIIWNGSVSEMKSIKNDSSLESIFINLTGGEKVKELLALI